MDLDKQELILPDIGIEIRNHIHGELLSELTIMEAIEYLVAAVDRDNLPKILHMVKKEQGKR